MTDNRGVLTLRRKDFRRGSLTLRREDGRIVCETVEVADTIWRRMRGLLGRSGLEPDSGLLLRPAWSIHTAFMRFPIDVVFVDHDLIVIRIAASVRSFRTASCRGAREVIELAAGEAARRGLEVGDRVAWAARNETWSDGSAPAAGAESRPCANVVVASDDARFVKVVRFLLDGQDGHVVSDVRLSEVTAAIQGEDVDGVLLDGGDRLGDALRLANGIRARRPDLRLVIAVERAAGRSSPFPVFDKWDEMDDAISVLRGNPSAG